MTEQSNTAWSAEGDSEAGTVVFTGEIDFTNSLAVREWLRAFIDGSDKDLDLNLADLTYIDSSGLAVFIEIRKYLKARNRGVKISAVSSQVYKLFTLTQIGDLFGI